MWSDPSDRSLPKFRNKLFFLAILIFMVVAAFLGVAVLYFIGKKIGIRLAYDTYDMGVYFASARWIIMGGRLYREVPSEYPLFANIIFATYRYVAQFLHPGIWGFFILWIGSSLAIYLFAVRSIVTRMGIVAALPWLAPAPVYFALFRFDLYPAVATLISLFAIRRAAYGSGALWLGVAIALKGYALFLLPAYCVFMVYQRGITAAIKIGALAAGPMILALFATCAFAGSEGVLAPFTFHAARTLNGETTYDAINYLFSVAVISGPEARSVALYLQVGCAIAAAAMLPRNFEDLVNSFLFAVLGFVSFSVFYSPQFLLWILPLVCFSASRVMLISAITLSWLTYIYFPIGYDLMKAGQPVLLKTMIVATASLRLFMMYLVIKQRYGGNFSNGVRW